MIDPCRGCLAARPDGPGGPVPGPARGLRARGAGMADTPTRSPTPIRAGVKKGVFIVPGRIVRQAPAGGNPPSLRMNADLAAFIAAPAVPPGSAGGRKHRGGAPSGGASAAIVFPGHSIANWADPKDMTSLREADILQDLSDRRAGRSERPDGAPLSIACHPAGSGGLVPDELGRRQTELLPEGAGEVAGLLEAEALGEAIDAVVAGLQQAAGLVDPHLLEVGIG